MFVHGTPRDPDYGGVHPSYEFEIMVEPEFTISERITFCGRFGKPVLYASDKKIFLLEQDLLSTPIELSPSKKFIICPGTVGSPYEKSTYAVLHQKKITFYRVHYDVQKVIDKFLLYQRTAYLKTFLLNFLGFTNDFPHDWIDWAITRYARLKDGDLGSRKEPQI